MEDVKRDITLTSIRVNSNLWKEFKIWCIKNKISISEQIEKLIKEGIQK